MRNKKKALPAPYAAPTRDMRFAGTFEVLVPVPNRVKPQRVPRQFASKEEAETWMHTPDGKEIIEQILDEAGAENA